MASRKNVVRPYTRSEQVQTTLTRAEREQLDARAAVEVVSRADLIRRLIVQGLNTGKIVGVVQHAEIVPDEVKQRSDEMQRLWELQRRNRT